MSVHLQPSSGFLVYYQRSPCIQLEEFVGRATDPEAPDWVIGIRTLTFWQPRAHIVEVVAVLALSDINQILSAKILSWCEHVSVRIHILWGSICSHCSVSKRGSYAHEQFRSAKVQAFHRTQERNSRSHKPRASDVSPTTAQSRRARLMLLEDSPVKSKQKAFIGHG